MINYYKESPSFLRESDCELRLMYHSIIPFGMCTLITNWLSRSALLIIKATDAFINEMFLKWTDNGLPEELQCLKSSASSSPFQTEIQTQSKERLISSKGI